MISTRDLRSLPDAAHLRRVLQSMAVLDAILSPEWEFRYYSFDSRWGDDQQMGSMRDGSGDDLFVHFGTAGCWIKGFAHESPMSPWMQEPTRVWPGVLDAVPPEFADCLAEPAFNVGDTTFCIWRRHGDPNWATGPVHFPDGEDPDGSELLLSGLDADPATYRTYAHAYYERDVSLDAVRHIYAHRPLTQAIVAALNPEVTMSDLAKDAAGIGYATA